MKRFLAALLFAAIAILQAGPTSAGLIEISLVPSIDKIHPPQSLFLDINISGLQTGGIDNLLGAWSMDVLYDSSIFEPLLIPPAGFGDRLGNVFLGEAIGGVDMSAPGQISLFLVSLLLDSDLSALQRDSNGNLLGSFTLATLGFFAPGGSGFNAPSTFIGTSDIILADAFGNPLADVSGAPIPIQHIPVSIRVPEPATLTLLAAGLIGALIARRCSRPTTLRIPD